MPAEALPAARSAGSGLIDATPMPTPRKGRKKNPSKKSYLKEASPILPKEVYSPVRRKRTPPWSPRNSSASCPSGLVSSKRVYLGKEDTPGMKTRATCPRPSTRTGSGAGLGTPVAGYAQEAGCEDCGYERAAGLGAGAP